MGIILNRANKIFKNKISNLNDSAQELNVNKIHRANNFSSKRKIIIGHIKIINTFQYCKIYINQKINRTSSDQTRKLVTLR